VLVNAKNVATTKSLLALSNLPDIEEIHTVAGDSGMMLKVLACDTEGVGGTAPQGARH
jgi:Lrp/AsnC family leucine-responsive transcriptional regulator